MANHGGRKCQGHNRVTYYPDTLSQEPTLPVASRAEQGALLAMCVLIPLFTAANCSLFSRRSSTPTSAPAAPQSVIQLAALPNTSLNRPE